MEETIKENESTPPVENLEGALPPSSPKKHKIGSLIKEMWPAYLIEIFVIILGISITLALEEWRDSNKDKHLEQIYRKNLRADIELDLQSLNYVTAGTQKLLDRGNELLAYVRDPVNKPITSSQIDSDVRAIVERPKFISNDATFSDLKSSGNLRLLEDIQLKNLLFAYYNQTQYIRENQDAEQQATIIISGAYFLKQFRLDDRGNQQPAPGANATDWSKNIEFSNNIILRVGNRKDLLYLYQKADSLAIQLDHALLAERGPGD